MTAHVQIETTVNILFRVAMVYCAITTQLHAHFNLL